MRVGQAGEGEDLELDVELALDEWVLVQWHPLVLDAFHFARLKNQGVRFRISGFLFRVDGIGSRLQGTGFRLHSQQSGV